MSPPAIRVYQAQKSFSMVSRAAKPGSKILLLAALQKGFGADVYFDYVCPFAEPEEIERDFAEFGYAMGPGMTHLFGGMFEKINADDFNGLESRIMKHCHLRAADPSTIIAEWMNDFEGTPEVAVIPDAVTTYFPYV